MIPFQITFLGSGSAVPSLHRAATSQLLRYGNRLILIDCAEGTQLILQRMHTSPVKLEKILISHLHGDHYFGLIGMINTMHLMGRTDPLSLYGPAALYRIIQIQLAAAKTSLRFPLRFIPLLTSENQLLFADKHLKCLAFSVKHRIPAWGFRFDEQTGVTNVEEERMQPTYQAKSADGNTNPADDPQLPNGGMVPSDFTEDHPQKARSYAFCTDTAFHPPIAETAHGVSLLYHEATFASNLQTEAEATWHSTTVDAARIAMMAKAQKLVIGHFSSRYKDVEPLVAEAKAIFGNTLAAYDGLTISL